VDRKLTMEIYKRMAEASKKIGAISKDDMNKQQGFKFRGIDAIYNGVHEALAANEIICSPKIVRFIREKEITTAKGGTGWHIILEIEYTFYAPDGSSITATTWGEGIDYGDKAINKCMSIAHKYALLQIFTIPTVGEMDDPDIENAVMSKKPRTSNEKIADMLVHFAGFGIVERHLELFLKKPLESMNDKDLASLRALFSEIKAGKTIEQVIEERSSAKSKIENM